jgi:hypothetical protein
LKEKIPFVDVFSGGSDEAYKKAISEKNDIFDFEFKAICLKTKETLRQQEMLLFSFVRVRMNDYDFF